MVGEVVSRTSSFLLGRRHRERLSTREGIERLEMAHIKMEAALEASGRWRATDASLLRWRRKLRRAADECDAALHRWKLRELQEEEARERLARARLPRRVAHAVLRFVAALRMLARGGGSGSGSDDARAAVQRFERLAGGAAEFLRYVGMGSAPRRMFDEDDDVRRLGKHGSCCYGRMMMLQGPQQQQQRFLRAGAAGRPPEIWVDGKPCRAYGKRRASGKKLLLV